MSIQCWKYWAISYPQKGSIAIGSCLTTPTWPLAAAVVSEVMADPMNTPWSQLLDWCTSGSALALLPPNMMASIGTPSPVKNSSAMVGQFSAGAVNLELGWAPFSVEVLPFHGFPSQSSPFSGGFLSSFSHHTVLSSRFLATLVNMVFLCVVLRAFGFDFSLVPGATPKNPFSGFTA